MRTQNPIHHRHTKNSRVVSPNNHNHSHTISSRIRVVQTDTRRVLGAKEGMATLRMVAEVESKTSSSSNIITTTNNTNNSNSSNSNHHKISIAFSRAVSNTHSSTIHS